MYDCFDWNFNCAAIIWHEPTPQVARPSNFSYRAGNAAAPALMHGSCRPLRKAAAPQHQHSSGETIWNTLPSKWLHCSDTCSRPLNDYQGLVAIGRDRDYGEVILEGAVGIGSCCVLDIIGEGPVANWDDASLLHGHIASNSRTPMPMSEVRETPISVSR